MSLLSLALTVSVSLAPVDGAGPAASHSQAYTHFLLAKHALGDNDYARAIDEFAQARNLDPDSAIIRVELGEVYLRLRRYKDAQREAQRAVELDPGGENGLDLLAQIYESIGETDKALETLRRLADTHPDQAMFLVRMAALQDRAGRTDEAVKLLEEAVTRDPRSTDAVYELVDRFQQLGRVDRAIETLERAATADPENFYVRSKLAEVYLQVRDEKHARQALEAMVAIQPGNVQVLLEVARAFRQMDDDTRAARLYRKAVLLKPDDEAIRTNLALALTRSGEYREALGVYRTLLAQLDAEGGSARNAERFEFLKRIGLLEIELGDVKAAVEALEAARAHAPADDVDFLRVLSRAYELESEPKKALELFNERARGRALNDPKSVDLHLGRAGFLILTGDVEAGLKLYRDLAAATPLDMRQHAYIAYALARKGREDACEEALKAAVKLAPAEEKRAYVYVAGLLFEAKEKDLGFRILEKLLGRYPDDRELHLQLARSHAREGDLAEAARVLEKAVSLFHDDADMHFQLGATYERLKRIEDAERELDASIAIEPKHAMALNYVAYLLAERGDKLDKALDYARRAVALEPDNGAYLDTLGWALYRLGKLEEARIQLQLSIERIADDPTVREHLADVLARLGDHAGARREYEKALELPGGEAQSGVKEKLERERLLLTATPERKPGE